MNVLMTVVMLAFGVCVARELKQSDSLFANSTTAVAVVDND